MKRNQRSAGNPLSPAGSVIFILFYFLIFLFPFSFPYFPHLPPGFSTSNLPPPPVLLTRPHISVVSPGAGGFLLFHAGLSKITSRIFLRNTSELFSHIPFLNLYIIKQNFHENRKHAFVPYVVQVQNLPQT
jgi:hypothetical protein